LHLCNSGQYWDHWSLSLWYGRLFFFLDQSQGLHLQRNRLARFLNQWSFQRQRQRGLLE
jgi:hypothetical protein